MFLSIGREIGCFILISIYSYVLCIQQYGPPGNTLYVSEDVEYNSKKLTVVNYAETSDLTSNKRIKREVPVTPALHKNISTWTTHLNDSHQQLMVHWVGEGSNVIICLARDSSPRSKGSISPSSLFISYDYGKNFTNKTESFKLGDTADSGYAQLDKFFNHPKYPEHCIFVDSTNKKIYYTTDNGQNIYRSDLSFHPSELAFDEELPNKFVVLDKVDINRKLFLTVDGGRTYKQIQSYVKTFFWSSGVGFPKIFFVERWKPNGTSTIFSTNDPKDLLNAKVLFEDAKDFQIKGDYMFATKQAKERNTLDLYVSHQRGPFYKAEFQTELDLKKFHIADVTDKRIFVSVMHTESLANLYVSEISKNFTQYNFILSLEQILCYFPEGNWRDSWLEDVTEDPFTDLYRVEGLKGIYIASKVDSKFALTNIGPEHVVSLITFDHGSTWSPINPPTEDENGSPLSCLVDNSCSLHLCQKFSQLYPVTRSASIMSSKSAPGIIMATGVMGKSLKGIPGVYLSRDAGLTWKRILKDYYFFNFGDHGGILVAVKYFKSRGETRQILYSTNEGIDWNSFEFNAEDLRIYGLMTEPGENTTTFTMFGSANDQHQWIIITIDLQNAFSRNCTSIDYKFWSPSPPNSSISCVLGTRDTFQRRIAHNDCYNGLNYERPVKKEICDCSRRDFECDYGFMLSGKECVRNKSVRYDPFEIPKDCQPGNYYKRTKGYRKIDGDVCTDPAYLIYAPETIPCPLQEPTEFLLVALRDKIARIDLSNNDTIFPVTGQKNIVAIEFDIRSNCIYWADVEMDKIYRQCFNNNSTQEIIVDKELTSIEGMALDWISNVLFFVDGMRKKIEAVRTDLINEGRMRTTIIDSKVLSRPRGIAVHPKAGYLFWTDWDRFKPSLSRSNLDGTDIKLLFSKPIVEWPNGVTIDHMTERIYWVDAMRDYIASADLEGHYFRRILWSDAKVSHPFAVSVLKEKVYWDDWKAKSIFAADKDTGSNIITVNDSLAGLMDLKAFAYFTQHGNNACSWKNNTCDALCLGGPRNTFSCLCPDGFSKKDGKCVCPNGLLPTANMTCQKKEGSCAPGEFACKNGMCVSELWRCDGNNDCGDLSDEIDCTFCPPPMIPCDGRTRCIMPSWHCDGDNDCADMSDESNCGHHNCTATQFTCDNGHCIDKKWLCDGDNDCKDFSDERNCKARPKRPDLVNCTSQGFECGNDNCIPISWVCDGEHDCPGGEDEGEERCRDSTCAPYMFRCPNGKCIFKAWVCDGENDCTDEDSADEYNCTNRGHSKVIPRPSTESAVFPSNSTCHDWMFKCANGNCLPYWWRCDHVDDCGDGSDEIGCGQFLPESTTTSPDRDSKRTCSKNQFTCSPGVCIPLLWVCDMAEDCLGGEDERGCSRRGGTTFVCAPEETPCADGRGCISESQLCDGVANCLDRSDETHCGTVSHKPIADCPADFFSCDDGTMCISTLKLCNEQQDCYDGSDELNCSSSDTNRHIYQFLSIGVDQSSINSTSFLISCWMAQQKMVLYSFLPSISKVSDGIWQNMSWTNDSIYRFTDLEPYTNYNVTFYIRDSKSNKSYASMKYVNTTTGEGVPSPPLKPVVHQLTGRRVNVVWDPPKEPNGVIKEYTVFYTPPIPPIERKFFTNDVNITGFFRPTRNFSFWVTATNSAYTSNSSEVVIIEFDEAGDVDNLANVSVSRPNDSSVFLTWHKIQGVEGYIVQQRLPREYARPKVITTKANNATLINLPPGVQMFIDIMAYKGSITGIPFTIPLKIKGEPDETLQMIAILQKDKQTSVQLKWPPPTGSRYKNKELQYEVHYNHTFSGYDRYFDEPQIVTTNTSVVIDGLLACESFIFTVGLLGGPLAPVTEIVTRENPKAPVKRLNLEIDRNSSKLFIKWNSNCDVIREPVTYMVEITEETTNVTSGYELTPTMNITNRHVIENIPIGGRYKVCVSPKEKGAAVNCGRIRASPVNTLQNVVAWLAPNGHVMVSWTDPDENVTKSKHLYEILISDKEIPQDIVHPGDDIEVLSADSSPYLAVTKLITKGPLYVSVRSVTPDGYYSDVSEVQTLAMEGAESETTSEMGAIWWGAVGAGIALLALGGALVHVALRNRRLARSFLRFTSATPRYDSRSGEATISDHDDDDVPPIHGFSDDEPLVIA